MTPDRVLEALEGLEAAIEANNERHEQIKARIANIRAARAEGRTYAQIVPKEPSPLIVQLVTECASALDRYGVRLRRIEAQVLYDEGLTMEQIAVLFGVSRQRVSTLLKANAR